MPSLVPSPAPAPHRISYPQRVRITRIIHPKHITWAVHVAPHAAIFLDTVPPGLHHGDTAWWTGTSLHHTEDEARAALSIHPPLA